MGMWPLTASHHDLLTTLRRDIICWHKSYHPGKHATHGTGPGGLEGTDWVTHQAWCSQTPVRAKHSAVPLDFYLLLQLTANPHPQGNMDGGTL